MTECCFNRYTISYINGVWGDFNNAGFLDLFGFGEQDIQILISLGKLTPLDDPAPNAPKWFAAIGMINLAVDKDWLHKATKEISKYWRNKCERHLQTNQ